MSNFHTLIVKEVSKITSDSVSITFSIPEELKSNYKFVEGQYITLKINIDGKAIQRAYSIWKAPYENQLSVLVKKVENGIFSTFANETIKQGDSIEVMIPQGNFVPNLNSENKKHYTLISAGSGITPVFSIVKQILYTEANSKIDLFYVNKTKESTIFQKEIEEIENANTENFTIHYMYTKQSTSNPILQGRINSGKLEELLQANILNIHSDQYFLCGPEQMILDTKEFLENNNVTQDKIKFELFTTTAPSSEEIIETDFTESKIILTIDDDEFEYNFDMKNSDSILEEGIKQGLDLPYSCKGGVCCTCRAKIMEGKVKMKINYALTDQEVEDGYVLTCQSIPLTSTLKVNFDE